jgi:hypothetical protein
VSGLPPDKKNPATPIPLGFRGGVFRAATALGKGAATRPYSAMLNDGGDVRGYREVNLPKVLRSQHTRKAPTKGRPGLEFRMRPRGSLDACHASPIRSGQGRPSGCQDYRRRDFANAAIAASH